MVRDDNMEDSILDLKQIEDMMRASQKSNMFTIVVPPTAKESSSTTNDRNHRAALSSASQHSNNNNNNQISNKAAANDFTADEDHRLARHYHATISHEHHRGAG